MLRLSYCNHSASCTFSKTNLTLRNKTFLLLHPAAQVEIIHRIFVSLFEPHSHWLSCPIDTQINLRRQHRHTQQDILNRYTMCERLSILQLEQVTRSTNNRHSRGSLKAVCLQMLYRHMLDYCSACNN